VSNNSGNGASTKQSRFLTGSARNFFEKEPQHPFTGTLGGTDWPLWAYRCRAVMEGSNLEATQTFQRCATLIAEAVLGRRSASAKRKRF
jgi:hypothetical protein